MQRKWSLSLLFLSAVLAGCGSLGIEGFGSAPVTDESLAHRASAGPFEAVEARVITDNDQALLSKVKMIEGARKSIDMAYFLYADDYSSSYLTRALLDAARRGVNVRLLVDLQNNYKRLDLFSMMEKRGGDGGGSLQVRFYNRPTRNIVQDAAYMTMGCGKESAASRPAGQCSKDKFDAIDALFAGETVNGRPAAERNISNLNVGNSGLFLSGLYGRRPDIMATAVQQGADIDPSKLGQGASTASAQDRQNLKKLAKTYWESRTGPAFQRVESKAQMYLLFSLFGEKLDPIYDLFTSLVPAEKHFSTQEREDWNHLTDYTHHKLILVDGVKLQMGGRNVEDSYHMRPNSLTEKYVFMDTDLYAELSSGGDAVGRSFDALWNFDSMVATLAEVRQHAPNELVANLGAYKEAEQACAARKAKSASPACVDKAFQARAKDLSQRIDARAAEMERKAGVYRSKYLPKIPARGAPSFEVDKGALLAYLENVPFDRSRSLQERRRIHGASVGDEAKDGKYLHDIWLRSLADVCRGASKAEPKQVILHNAYFFPAANMTYALSRMVDGAHDCSNVKVTVLTNSIQTTDLNIVNLVARHSLKAFTEFYQQHSDPARRATIDYVEYRAKQGGPNLSLHTKVSVLGDDLLVGSANADVRSLMMDSNNAMFVRRAPNFNKAYVEFLNGILVDAQRVQRLNDYFAKTPRDAMLQEDVATFRQLLAKYHAERHLDPQQQKLVEQQFVEMLNAAYTLTKESISPSKSTFEQREQQNRFNELFKPI
jgi:phosphatidylserine/phosphatidylglycerophosphate/cardiolipin synthase-like enzyme